MTRDEAKEKAFKCEGFHSGVNYQEHLTDGIWLLRSDVLNFVDKIYDEFENRICDNCIHIDIKQSRGYETATCTNVLCIEMYDCDVGSIFGCNYFERIV